MEMPSFRNTFLSTFIKYRQSFAQICNGNAPSVVRNGASHSVRVEARAVQEVSGEGLTNVLVALYEDTEKPNNASDFIKHQLGVGPEAEDAESLRLELNTLQQKYDQLMEENKELRSRLLQGGGTE